MKKEHDNRDMLPEYDFSGGVRGKYAARFRESRQELLSSATALDRQAWMAHSLLAFQAFESWLVAYRTLVFGEDPESAGKTVSALLEALDDEPLDSLWRDLREHTSVSESFREDLLELVADRNWLVHWSFHDLGVSEDGPEIMRRFESIVERSAHLSEQLSSSLLQRCMGKGMERSEVEERTEEIVSRWAAGRNAA